MYSGISGMKANQTKLDVIANNIANVSTTSFKASKVNFADTLYQSTSTATSPTASIGGTNAKAVGLGAKVSSINKLMTKGNALSTGRSLDVCVDGDGYFIASKGTVAGTLTLTSNAVTGTTDVSDKAYTRDGNLSLDQDGNLLTSNGYRIMGYRATGSGTVDSTGKIVIGTRVDPDAGTVAYDADLKPLAIPDKIGTDAIQSFAIGSDGVITATTSVGKSVIGQIAMASFKNPEGLKDLGGNFEQETGNSGVALIMDNASVAAASSNSGAFGSITQGYLEASNVDLTEQFTDMISATRAFQASSKMISNGDEILQTITGLIR
jgi:flagellar hook protein FlgE